MTERDAAVTLKGAPKTLLGDELKTGDAAPAFKLVGTDFGSRTLGDFAGKVKLLVTAPSIDTPVCDSEIRRFNEEAAEVDEDVEILVVTMDLPPSQARWCAASDVDRVTMLSDYMDHSFGHDYGVRIKEMGLLARTVMVLDRDDKVRYVQLVKEVAEQPDFDAALAAVKSVVG